MVPLVEAAIAGFNHFLQEQQNAPGQARLTLVLFDDTYLKHVDAIPVHEVIPLDTTTYVPGASTALLDAIGRTIDELGARLERTAEADRPGKVTVAILTDGLENASRHYTWRDVSERIKHQTEKYSWEFLFLGANQDAIATALALSIDPDNSANWNPDIVGTRAASEAFSRRSASARSMRAGTATAADKLAAATPLQELVREEDEKRRKKT